jgi:glycosyltransferase involved in cell wall biosynthesis
VLREHREADVVNLTSFLNESMLGVIYPACDAVLANSGHEPFGLVGLEVMAAGGLAVTGATGEDYAVSYRNALVLETDDAIELVTELNLIQQRPRLAADIRRRGRVTARTYVWEKVIDQLLLRIEFAAAQQAVRLPEVGSEYLRPLRRRPRKPEASNG